MTWPDDFQPFVSLGDVVLGLGFGHAYWYDGEATRFDRFIQLLERLDEAQRTRLRLTPQQLAALTMLDELRGLYATSELEQAKRLVDRVLRDLEDAYAFATACGEAKVMRPINPDLGRLAELALATFTRDPDEGLARVRQLRTLAEPLSMERRRAAFATIDPPGFEMIRLPVAVVHPSKWADAAAKLGLAVEDARVLLSEQDRGLLVGDRDAKLGDELVRAIPLIPEDERPTLYIPPATWFAGTTTAVEPLSEAYAALQARIVRFDRLVELQAPALIIENEAFVFQRIVDRIADAAAAQFDTTTLDGWGALDGPIHPQLPHPGHLDLEVDADDTPPSCVWLTDDRIAVAVAGIMRILSIADSRMIHEAPIGEVQMQSCDDRYIITTANSTVWGERGVTGFGCYDTEARAFVDAMPDHLPAVSFGYDEDWDNFNEASGGGQLMDHRRGGYRALHVGEWPTSLAWARGNDAALLYPRGIFSTRTLIEEVSARVLANRAPIVEEGASAITRIGERWRFLLPSRHVCEVDKTLFDITFMIDAAAFSPDGSRLLVIAEGEARIVDIAQRQVVWRHVLA